MKDLIKIFTIGLVFSFGLVGESKAEEINCKNLQSSCGTNCCWNYDSSTNKLTITGGADGSVGTMQSAPWSDYKSDMKIVSIDGVTNVLNNAFESYSAIETVNIGDSVKTIGTHAFLSDDKLKNLNLGNSVETIGSSAFQWTIISSVDFPDSLKTIANQAFYGARFKTIDIPDGTESIGRWAFGYGLQSIKSLTLPDTVSLGDEVFAFSPYVSAEVICKGNRESCAAIQSKIEPSLVSLNSRYNLANTFDLADISLCDGNYYWNGIQCNNKKNGINCAEGFKADNGLCWRVRYTPAEAAKIVGESNTIYLFYK